jgi:Cu+-exporting ATPase
MEKNQSTIFHSLKCSHCSSPIPGEGIKGFKDESFCCEGCKTVFQILNSEGREFYYKIKGKKEISPVVLENSFVGFTEIDYEDFIHKNQNIFEIKLQVTNIHCSACVWLIESILKEKIGVEDVRLQSSTGILYIKYDINIITLSEIHSILDRLGYKIKVFDPKQLSGEEYIKSILYRIGLAVFSWMNLMAVSVALYTGYFQGISWELKNLFHWLSWAFATPVYLYSMKPYWNGFFNTLRTKKMTIDFLVIFGISMAYFYSIYILFNHSGEVYFDSVVTISLFLLFGKYIEAKVKMDANLKLTQLIKESPETSVLIQDNKEIKIKSKEIKINDKIKIFPGETIPADGLLLSNSAYVSESFLTGEASPIWKKENQSISAGSVCLGNPILIRVTSAYRDSTIQLLSQILEMSLSEKPVWQQKIDKVAKRLVKLILILAGFCFVYYGFRGDWDSAILNSISILIVACPCALGLAVPLGIVLSTIKLSDHGIILKKPDLIEQIPNIKTIVWDKTGTLTEGNPKLINPESLFHIPTNLKNLIYSLSNSSTHPYSKKLTELLESNQKNLNKDSLFEIEEVPGFGVKGKDHTGQFWYLGSPKFLNTYQKTKKSSVYFGNRNDILYQWEWEDQLRKDAKLTISKLKKLGIQNQISSGDQEEIVREIGKELGMDSVNFLETPESKKHKIIQLSNGKQGIAMIGDGWNDSLAVAIAGVGIAMGHSIKSTLKSADVVLVRDNILNLADLWNISLSAKKIIQQNILISFTYNSIMIPLAFLGLMQPVWCALFMTMSSLSVILNSLRIYKT